MNKRMMLSMQALLASGVVAFALLSTPAHARVDLFLNVAPPEPQVEVVPPPRSGYVWAPGFWEWRGHHHVWVEGHWVRARVGYHWLPDRWDRDGERWHYFRGHWERD